MTDTKSISELQEEVKKIDKWIKELQESRLKLVNKIKSFKDEEEKMIKSIDLMNKMKDFIDGKITGYLIIDPWSSEECRYVSSSFSSKEHPYKDDGTFTIIVKQIVTFYPGDDLQNQIKDPNIDKEFTVSYDKWEVANISGGYYSFAL